MKHDWVKSYNMDNSTVWICNRCKSSFELECGTNPENVSVYGFEGMGIIDDCDLSVVINVMED